MDIITTPSLCTKKTQLYSSQMNSICSVRRNKCEIHVCYFIKWYKSNNQHMLYRSWILQCRNYNNYIFQKIGNKRERWFWLCFDTVQGVPNNKIHRPNNIQHRTRYSSLYSIN
jgi:hypothetical protein